MSPTLDIILVNYNAGEALFSCVASIAKALDDSFDLLSVTVVDNGSKDGSADMLGALDLPIKIIRNGENIGFGAACNRGAAQSEAEYVLFLNPDTLLFPESLRVPMAAINGNKKNIGMCSIRLINDQGKTGRSCARFPRPMHFILRAFYIGRLFPGPNTTHFMLEWDHETTREVDHVMGAFLLMPRSLFDALDGFDTRFFMYLEDVDLSLRAHRLGFKSLYIAEAKAFHKGGGTSEKVKDRRLFYSIRSRIQYSFKHFKRPAAIGVSFFALVIEPVTRLLYALVRLRLDEAGQTLKGYGRLYAWCFRPGRRV